jgi:nitroreductase
MDVFTAITTRRSIRQYRDEPVPAEKLAAVLETARIAPSGGNRQNWKFIVVTEKATRERLIEAANSQAFVGQAGAVIVCCAPDPSLKWHMVDVAIAIDHMTLAAHALGLGTCWIGAFNEAKVKEILGIPEGVKVVQLLPVGIPATTGVPKPRKTLDEIVVWENWS